MNIGRQSMMDNGLIHLCWLLILIMERAELLQGAVLTASTCFNATSLKFSCETDQMIRILNASYGHSLESKCEPSPNDCSVNDYLQYQCVGKQSCTINISTGKKGKFLDPCQNYSTYFAVNYMCIKASQVFDICQNKELTAQKGYIATPNYPYNYQASQKCNLTIRSSYPKETKTLSIYALDFDLATNNSGCLDKLYIYSLYKSGTICGNRLNLLEPQLVTRADSVTLQFTSIKGESYKGFWLYFEAEPLYEPKVQNGTITTHENTTKHVRLKEEDVTVSKPSITTESTFTTTSIGNLTRHVHIKHKKFPAVAVLGGVLGALLVILFVLIILLLIKRKRDGKHIRSGSRAQLYATPGTSFNSMQIHNNVQAVEEDFTYMAHCDI